MQPGGCMKKAKHVFMQPGGCMKMYFTQSLGNWGSETVLVFSPESVSYERSRPMNRCILREISARVFFGKSKKSTKTHISSISRMWENWKNPFSNISRIGLNQKNPFSNISRILENVADLNFQYFQDRNK